MFTLAQLAKLLLETNVKHAKIIAISVVQQLIVPHALVHTFYIMVTAFLLALRIHLAKIKYVINVPQGV